MRFLLLTLLVAVGLVAWTSFAYSEVTTIWRMGTKATGAVTYKGRDSSGSFVAARSDATPEEEPYPNVYGGKDAQSVGTFSLSDSRWVSRTIVGFVIPENISASTCTLACRVEPYNSKALADSVFALSVPGASPDIDASDFLGIDGYTAGDAAFDGTILAMGDGGGSSRLEYVFNADGVDSLQAAVGDTLWLGLVSDDDYWNTPQLDDYRTWYSDDDIDYSIYTMRLLIAYEAVESSGGEAAVKRQIWNGSPPWGEDQTSVKWYNP